MAPTPHDVARFDADSASQQPHNVPIQKTPAPKKNVGNLQIFKNLKAATVSETKGTLGSEHKKHAENFPCPKNPKAAAVVEIKRTVGSQLKTHAETKGTPGSQLKEQIQNVQTLKNHDHLVFDPPLESATLSPDAFPPLQSPPKQTSEVLNAKPTIQSTKTFSSLFANNRNLQNGLSLEHFEPQDKITFEEEDIKPVEETWGHCLVGCFTGRFPGLKAIETLTATWGKQVTIIPHTGGWIVFKFEDEDGRFSVLKNAPYTIRGVNLILKKPTPNFSFDHEEFLKVPTWVKVSDIPAGLWHQKGLSKIASNIGSPICTDEITAKGTRLGFARFLVEVDAAIKPLHYIEGSLPCGKSLKLKVSYESFPNFCCFCKKIGHNAFTCKLDAQGNTIIPIHQNHDKRKSSQTAQEQGVHEPSVKPTLPTTSCSHPPLPGLSSNTAKGRQSDSILAVLPQNDTLHSEDEDHLLDEPEQTRDTEAWKMVEKKKKKQKNQKEIDDTSIAKSGGGANTSSVVK